MKLITPADIRAIPVPAASRSLGTVRAPSTATSTPVGCGPGICAASARSWAMVTGWGGWSPGELAISSQ